MKIFLRCVNLWFPGLEAMFYEKHLKRFVFIGLIMIFGLFVQTYYGQNANRESKIKPCDQINEIPKNVTGISADTGFDGLPTNENLGSPIDLKNKSLQIISKPKAVYTVEARKNCIQGKVIIKVTFFANGSVGRIKVLKGLCYGLSNKAVEAAKFIKFKPEIKNNKAITVTKKVTYNFTIY